MPLKKPKIRTKFPTKAILQSLGITNPITLGNAFVDRIVIHFSPSSASQRGGRGAYFSVHYKGRVTDPGAHWMDYGHKVFSVEGSRNTALAKAIEWTNEKYGEREWIRDPWGSYQDQRTIAAVWALVTKKEEEHVGLDNRTNAS
jgi:hypothetical protein